MVRNMRLSVLMMASMLALLLGPLHSRRTATARSPGPCETPTMFRWCGRSSSDRFGRHNYGCFERCAGTICAFGLESREVYGHRI